MKNASSKKVAFLDYSPHYAGAERAMASLISGLKEYGYEPCIVVPYPIEHQKRYSELGVEIISLNSTLKWWMGSDRWKSPLRGTDFLKRLILGFQLRRALIKRDISILHVNLLRPDCAAWLYFSRLAGIKIVGHYRSLPRTWIPPVSVRKLCHQIVCVSKIVEQNLEDVKATENHCVVYDPVSTHLSTNETTEESKLRWETNPRSFLFASVAYLSPNKGHDNALHAFAQVAKKHDNCELLIAGGGSNVELQRLKGIADSYPAIRTRIKFTEEQVSDVASVYNAADVVLSLTKDGEAFGLVPYEAALFETPCIAPRLGAIMELTTHKENILLVNTLNIPEIATCMEYTIEHPIETHKMATNLKQLVAKKLSGAEHVQGMIEIYQSLWTNNNNS